MLVLLMTFQLWAAKPQLEFQHENSVGYVFDLPVTYNSRVQYWIHFYQTRGKKWFKKWLSRGDAYLPILKQSLAQAGLPQDLAYLAMIESGLSPKATSHAKAVGPWQFIKPTAERFGLKVNWWLDERRDYQKSTQAAVKYLSFLHKKFDSWYLAAAAYNTGEGRIQRLVDKYKTKDFWKLANSKSLMKETKEYIPKLVATMLMAKTPHLYGFRDISSIRLLESEPFYIPGGVHLKDIALHLNITKKALYDMNPELIRHLVPANVNGRIIRIPKGSARLVGLYFANKSKKHYY